jgi:hypothetical protein
LFDKLLPQIRAGVNEDLALLGLYKDRKTKTLALSTFSGVFAGRALTSNFRSSDSIAGPKQC